MLWACNGVTWALQLGLHPSMILVQVKPLWLYVAGGGLGGELVQPTWGRHRGLADAGVTHWQQELCPALLCHYQPAFSWPRGQPLPSSLSQNQPIQLQPVEVPHPPCPAVLRALCYGSCWRINKLA